MSEYNEMTPHELNLHLEIYGEKLKSQQDDLIVQSYLTAYYQRVKNMPRLSSLLSSQKEQKTMSDKQMLNVIKTMNAAVGGNVIRKGG